MSETSSRGTVFVTGGTGYLAGWIIVELLNRGYRVRASVRDAARAEPARRAILERSVGTHSLQFVQADLLDDEGWEPALDGVEAMLHTASPMPFDTNAPPDSRGARGNRACAHDGGAPRRAPCRVHLFGNCGPIGRPVRHE